MSNISADDFFSSKKQAIKQKFISEHNVKQTDENVEIKIPTDQRPLYQILAERRQEKDAEYDEKYRFANRIKKLDETEASFIEKLEEEKEEKERIRKKREQKALQEFRKAVEVEASAPVELNKIEGKKRINKQKEILSKAVKPKKQKTEKGLVEYPSSDDSN